MTTRLKVLLACTFPRDEKLGSSRTPLRLEPELRALGVSVRTIFAEDLPRAPAHARAAVLAGPLRVALGLERAAAEADVVDVAGGDGFLYFRAARLLRPRQALVARSNGLWDLALAGDDQRGRSRLKTLASNAYQQHVVCGFERASIRGGDMAVFLSEADAREVVRRGWREADATAAVNPGVDAFFASDVPLAARRDVAFCGTFFHRKGSDVVRGVMNRLLAEKPELTFSLFGSGMTAERVLAEFDPPVRARITVAEPLAAEALARRLERFAICLFPTRYEGFGIVVLEAMRAGLAIVTTATGAGADLIRDGANGLIVPVGSIESTYAATRRLLEEEPFRMRLAAAAAADAEGRTWRRAAEQLTRVYERAMQRARTSRA